MKTSIRCTLAALLAIVLAVPAQTAIEALTLRQMLGYADDGIVGTVVDRHVFHVDHAVDGTMYFTTITVEGASLLTGEKQTRGITFYGGIDDQGEGWVTTVTPSSRDTALGRKVVAFYAKTQAMGYGVAGNALIAAHGGLFQTAKRGTKELVLGRGRGFAIEDNTTVPALRSQARAIRDSQQEASR